MAATAFVAQAVPHAGLQVVYTIPTQTTGHTAPTGGDMALLVVNGSGAPINVDLHIPASNTVDGLVVATPAGAAAPSRRVVVTNAQTEVIPLPDTVYADSAIGGLCTFDVSAFATISIACVRVA
jgi:hypothetical protein